MSLAWFPIAVLGVWRITHLLVAEDGPGDALAKLHEAAGAGFWGTLLECFYCLSLWVAVPFALVLGSGWLERALLWPALSGGTVLLERLNNRPPPPPPALFVEHTNDGKIEDAMLRR
jgi:hypothetical protein